MKILLIASTDSYNYSLPRLYECFRAKGHQVTVLRTELGFETNFAIKDLSSIFYKGYVPNLKSYDIAIYENVLNQKLLSQLHNASVFCVSMYFHAFPSEYILGSGYLYGHLTFAISDNFKNTQVKNGVVQEIIPVGSPQYDDLKLEVKHDGNKLLFLEQHFYPAGDEGKEQLAKALIDTAVYNPDYEVVVKPRTLPKFHSQSKHKSRHLYNYVEQLTHGGVPENLTLLDEHIDLLKLTEEASVVATTFSTAVYPSLISKKPVLWIKGFAAKDIHYYNNNIINSYYDQYAQTGNVVDFSDLHKSLKATKAVKNKEVDNIIFKPDGHAGDRVVEILEYIFDNVISLGHRLPILGLSYENYQQKISEYMSGEDKQSTQFILFEQAINRACNSSLEGFYRLYMTSGSKHSEVFDKLKQEL